MANTTRDRFITFICIVTISTHLVFYNIAQYIYQDNPALFYKENQCKQITGYNFQEHIGKYCVENSEINNNNYCEIFEPFISEIENRYYKGVLANYSSLDDITKIHVYTRYANYIIVNSETIKHHIDNCDLNIIRHDGNPDNYLIFIIMIFLFMCPIFPIYKCCFDKDALIWFSLVLIVKQFLLMREISQRTHQFDYIIYPFIPLSIQLTFGLIMTNCLLKKKNIGNGIIREMEMEIENNQ